jgi:site-specific DNA-methyltransferase (adenine-specific)
MRIDIRQGDCLDRLDQMEADSIEVVVSDPPYDLTTNTGKGGFMGKEWDGTGISFSLEFWSRLFRVLLPGATVKVFGGTRTFHRMCAAMEAAGFVLEPEDSLEAWAYGSGFPKSHNVATAIHKALGGEAGDDLLPEAERWRGWGSALKPAWEPLVVGHKPA